MAEPETPYPWRHADEVFKRIQVIQAEARQATIQARAERKRAKDLIRKVTSGSLSPDTPTSETKVQK